MSGVRRPLEGLRWLRELLRSSLTTPTRERSIFDMNLYCITYKATATGTGNETFQSAGTPREAVADVRMSHPKWIITGVYEITRVPEILWN